MEMQQFLREWLTHTNFSHESEDGDLHKVAFIEELKDDGKEQVVCTECNESAVVGPTLKCNRCQYLSHVSCFATSTLYFHYGRRHDNDQLIFIEELRSDDGKEGVVCVACQEQVEGPGYKCSTSSKCNFRLHKSCAQLPRQIQCHPSHPNHILNLMPSRQYSSTCNACGKWCCTCIFYSCNKCNFNLDITCATRTLINNIDDCQHAFVPSFKQIHFTCDACGQEGIDFASLCTICPLFIHSRCAGFPRTIIISRHHHALTLIYSFHRQVKNFNDIFCNLCRQKVKTGNAAFCCQKCNFVVHLYCADARRRTDLYFVLPPEKSVDVMEMIKPGDQIQHFSHPHNLILSHEEVLNHKLCDGCMHFIISAPFYTCTQCHFFLHTTCAQLPKQKNHILHRHILTLLSDAPYIGGVYICNACGHSRHGFTYRCDRCDYDLDVQCCSIPEILKHEGHKHSLFLPVSSNKNCNACDHNYTYSKNTEVFVCTTCDFALGFECATLPLVARHKNDEHSLALTYVAENNFEEYYCLICEEERDSNYWFYYCEKCDFPAHPQCVLGKYPYIKFGTTCKSRRHQHPVTIVQKIGGSPQCASCDKTFEGMAIKCNPCKFINHYWDEECLPRIISNNMLHP